MAVNQCGEWVGRISSGCAEAAIAAEAVRAIGEQQCRVERYGLGSRYVDIRLPCGSGIDIFFDPCIPTQVVEELIEKSCERRPVGLTFDTSRAFAGSYDIRSVNASGPQEEFRFLREQNAAARVFTKMYFPSIRIDIAGRGPIMPDLARMANILKWEISLSSPDNEMLEELKPIAAKTNHLKSANLFDTDSFDGWTASVLLFHEHEWEPAILQQVLGAKNFYVGALGSRRAHRARREALTQLGINKQQLDQIRGPVGLDIGAKAPEEIALAIAGEILAAARGDRWIQAKA
jgi:xanthine dehydrogenase accessory factor